MVNGEFLFIGRQFVCQTPLTFTLEYKKDKEVGQEIMMRYPRRFRERYQQKKIDQVTIALDREPRYPFSGFRYLYGTPIHFTLLPEIVNNSNTYSSYKDWLQNVIYRPKKKYNKVCHVGIF